MSNMRIRHAETQKEMEGMIDEYITLGYKVGKRGENSATLKNSGYGSILVHAVLAVLFWWLLFIPNIVYLVYSMRSGDEVLVKTGSE